MSIFRQNQSFAVCDVHTNAVITASCLKNSVILILYGDIYQGFVCHDMRFSALFIKIERAE